MRNSLHRLVFLLAVGMLAGSPLLSAPAWARDILFVGNSFTFGANSAVHRYGAHLVSDLNGEGGGGVPALFKTFADEAGLDWSVSLETHPGAELAYHLAEKRGVIDRRWDAVILQGYSTLDPARPGDAVRHVDAARALASMFRRRHRDVQVDLIATWSRADQTYLPQGHWYGQPIERMADDLDAVTRKAVADQGELHAAIPVGRAWTGAIRDGVADPNPYDGIDYGRISLWSWNQYHASTEGYYLAALMVFGTVTGIDPRTLEGRERAADDLGIDPRVATRLRAIAAAGLSAQAS